mgnify:FL=1
MTTSEPPLIDVKVTNPVTYLKNWWDKVMGKEGVYFSFKIHPITAFLIAFGFTTGIFSIGRYSVNIPFLKYEVVNSPVPSPTPPIWKETAYTGTLQFSSATQKFYLAVTSSAELITLEVPGNIDLTDYVGKRILAIGNYNKNQKILEVTDAKTLEVLPKTQVSIPVSSPEPTVFPTPEASPSASPSL